MRTYRIEVQLADQRLSEQLLQRIKKRFPSDTALILDSAVLYTAWDDKTALQRYDEVQRIVAEFERDNRLCYKSVQVNPHVPTCLISGLAHGE